MSELDKDVLIETLMAHAEAHHGHNWIEEKPAQRTYTCKCGAQAQFIQWVIEVTDCSCPISLSISGLTWNELAKAVEIFRNLKHGIYKHNSSLRFYGRYQLTSGYSTLGHEHELRDFTDLILTFEHQFRKIRPTRWDWLRRQDEA